VNIYWNTRRKVKHVWVQCLTDYDNYLLNNRCVYWNEQQYQSGKLNCRERFWKILIFCSSYKILLAV
jgi:hypothetical protein